jgi:lipopolysaccharide export system permease protein
LAELKRVNIIDSYLLKRFFLTFFVAMFCFILIFDLVNLVERLGNLLEAGATLSDVFLYYFYFTPFIVVLTCPIATLLASIFSIGLMARSNELLAMKAAGISLYRIVNTLMAAGIVIAVGLWIFGEVVLPEANARKNVIEAEKFEKRSSESSTVYHNQMFQGLHGRVFQFTNYVTKSATGEDVVIQTFVGNKLTQLITADRFVWRDSIWVGSDVQVKTFGNFESDPEPIRNTRYETLPFPDFREKPSYFEDWFSRQDPLSMSYFKLKKFIDVSRALGKDVTSQLVDLENKVAFPFINVIIILIGVSLASNPRRSGLGVSFAVSMAISFVFYSCVKIAIEFGHEGAISPMLAAWGTNAAFLLIGLILLIRTPK